MPFSRVPVAFCPVWRVNPALPQAHRGQAIQMQSLWTLLCQIWSSRTSHEATFTKGTEGATNCSISTGNHSTVAGPIAQWALLTSAVAGGRTSSFLNTETGFKSPLAPASHHLYFSMKNNTKQALHRNKKCYAPLNQPQQLQYCSKRQHHIIPKLWIRVQIPASASFESSLSF